VCGLHRPFPSRFFSFRPSHTTLPRLVTVSTPIFNHGAVPVAAWHRLLRCGAVYRTWCEEQKYDRITSLVTHAHRCFVAVLLFISAALVTSWPSRSRLIPGCISSRREMTVVDGIQGHCAHEQWTDCPWLRRGVSG